MLGAELYDQIEYGRISHVESGEWRDAYGSPVPLLLSSNPISVLSNLLSTSPHMRARSSLFGCMVVRNDFDVREE